MTKKLFKFLFLIFPLLIVTFSCDNENPQEDIDVYGCTDKNACNYLESASIDDDSCVYIIDCEGVCGGLSKNDQCGICGGDNSTCVDCLGTVNGNAIIDCLGECNGQAIIDACGICGGDNSSCSDCSGTVNGNATTDCLGECNGQAIIDQCGVCNGNNNCDCLEYGIDVTKDCMGQCGGSVTIDECGVCGGDNSTCIDCLGIVDGNAITDCLGECNGQAIIDACGICAGDSSSCLDCSGTVNGNAITDCLGECNGQAIIDDCGVCSGGNTGIVVNESCKDCMGVTNGSAFYDSCGNCIAGDISWKINVLVDLLPFNNVNIPVVSDNENYFGANSLASDNFDLLYDIPEPPIGTNNWVSFYFRHQDWSDAIIGGQQIWKFTEDIKSNSYQDYLNSGKVWEAEIEGSTGMAKIEFIFSDDIDFATVYLSIDGNIYSIVNGTIIEDIVIIQNSIKDVNIEVSNLCF